MPIEIKAGEAKRSPERIEFLAGVLVTAVEGGINYWAEVQNYTHEHDATTSVSVRDMEATDEPLKRITIEEIDKAIGRIVRGEIKLADRLIIEIAKCDRENDAGQIDAESADCIMQVAAFGEVIFG